MIVSFERYDRRVDVLSDVITAARVGHPHASLNVNCPPWGSHFDRFDGAGFHVVLSGHAWLLPDHLPPIALGPGDVAFLGHGSAHGLADDPGTRLRAAPATASVSELPHRVSLSTGLPPGATAVLCGGYLLDPGRPHPLLDALPEVLHVPASEQPPSLGSALALLATELQTALPGRSAAVSALLDTLLVQLVRVWAENPDGERPDVGWAAALTDPWIAVALAAIHDDPSRPWSVEGLAHEAVMSRATFARRFNQIVGCPPMTYLTWWRMTLAARSLRTSDAPQADIAHRIGYSSEFAFAAAFKRCIGTSPGAYRRARNNHLPSAPAAHPRTPVTGRSTAQQNS